MNKRQKKLQIRIIIAIIMVIILQIIPISGGGKFFCYLAVYLIIGYDILRKAALGIWNQRLFDENFLMAIATVGAFALAIFTESGDYLEGIAVMLFYQIGEWFQSYAVGRSRKNIGALMDIRPDSANMEQEGELIQVDPSEVAVGSVIVVRPGERIPLDGIVVEGSAALNTSALTGESIPQDVSAGSQVVSGCINLTGVLKIRTTKPFSESTVSRILELAFSTSSRIRDTVDSLNGLVVRIFSTPVRLIHPLTT